MTVRTDEAAIEVGGRRVGAGAPALLIAEIGSNHDGKLDQARRLIDAAAAAGADAVKFQSFRAAALINRRWPAADGSWAPHAGFERLAALELPDPWLPVLRDHATARGVLFLSTPFDEASAERLCAAGVPAFKIASGDLTHVPLLAHVARAGRPILLSTGLADLDEVRVAVAEIARAAGAAPALVLLHCVSTYPPRWGEVNLRAIATLRATFGVPVGFSDHTPGHALALGARALGAAVIEKHLTLDRALPGPDHGFALTPEEFAAMASDLRHLEAALGDGGKRPAPGEVPERRWARRGVYAAVPIAAGTVLTRDVLKIVRPATGLSPAALDELLGRVARRAIAADEALAWDDVEPRRTEVRA
jgi:N-acetylneuraminate synthase/N,N'-diacetyllegionaminate synthase